MKAALVAMSRSIPDAFRLLLNHSALDWSLGNDSAPPVYILARKGCTSGIQSAGKSSTSLLRSRAREYLPYLGQPF